jgi:excinuclease ABC subunit A
MPQDPFEQLSAKEYIIIKGARIHNLKNIDVAIPRNKFVVITGLSGSGKSSLAFDTLYAEGQRRYVESLSSYARQFLGRINKPDVDYIKGISPAIAIEQKVNSRNPRSTVGTTTEIYDYLKLLFARIGKTYSPISGDEVKKHTVRDVITKINSFPKGTKVILIAPLLIKPQYTIEKQLQLLLQQGFTRVKYKDEILKIEDSLQLISEKKLTNATSDFAIFIDRFIADKEDEENENRIADSVQTAFFEGNGECFIEVLNETENRKN